MKWLKEVIKIKPLVYQKEEYVVWEANNGYVIHNTKKPFSKGHTHIRSKKRMIELIDNVIESHFPLHWSNYFIISSIRLTTDQRFQEELKHLHKTRLGKERRLHK